MSSVDEPLPLRERARRAIQEQLVDVAQELFVTNGYEATSVNAIAEAAGMSRRSFFRYFASKEDLILGKYEQLGEHLLDRLHDRPENETAWLSLRRVFDYMIEYAEDPAKQSRATELDRIINSSDSLRAGYLDRMQRIQISIADELVARNIRAGATPDGHDPRPRALVGAAFACLFAAYEVSASGTRTFREALDLAMSSIHATV